MFRIAHGAASARQKYKVDGTGVKIGVLSTSYNNLGGAATDISNGELPPEGVTLVGSGDEPSGGDDEGRAMLQIIHDLAPGAKLYFAKGLGGEADFANNVLALREAGCDIIADDIYYYADPVFQDGIIAQAINAVTASGALYFSSAGNFGNKKDGTSGVWEGNFFKTSKHRFGLHRFGQGTLLGVYRWLVLSLIAFILAHWAYLSTNPSQLPDWGIYAHLALQTLLPEVVISLLLLDVERTRPLLNAFGLDLQLTAILT